MAKKRNRSDPQLTEVHGILKKIRGSAVLRWEVPVLQARLTKLQTIQEQRGGGLFGMDITPEIAFLEAAIKVKLAA